MAEQQTKLKTRGKWSESAVRVLRERYLRRDENKEIIETPEEMCWRVATAIAAAEKTWGETSEKIQNIAEQFYELMVNRKFLPNSPTLMNAGVQGGLQYSACFVLPVKDSMPGIFEAVKRAAIIHQSGGGTGFSFSRLRPSGSVVRSSGGKASGPVSFMRVFDAATDAVKQGGRRRGANMGILRVDHPDIMEFITCKQDGGISNFNISVAITDDFMQAVERDEEYELIAPHTGEVNGRLRAREVFDKIVQAAWANGDPGLIFIDQINNSPANPTPELGQIEATNPCGEQPLLPNEACNLGSINLALFARPGIPVDDGRRSDVDWTELERTVRLAVRFLDDVIEVNPYPLPEIKEAVKGNRRIGLGVMGWADMLFKLGIPYDSPEALALADEIMSFIKRVGHDADAKLAGERGPFPNWEHSIYKNDRPRRNATVTTIAPTGSISIIAACSSGIEPAFALAFRHIVDERHLQFINPIFEQAARKDGFYSSEMMDAVARRGYVGGLAGVPEEMQRVFVTAHEVAPEWHVRMQAAWQKHVDNGVSKTVNLSNSATVDEVAEIYKLAYYEGCRGITVYRDGCKEVQVLHVGDVEEKEAAEQPPVPVSQLTVKPRARVLHGVTYQARTPLGTAYITVNENGSDQPFEVFTNVGKAGSDTAAVAEALGRLISLTLRMPSPLSPLKRMAEVAAQLSGIGGGRPMGFGPHRVRSLPDAIAQVLADHIGLAALQTEDLEVKDDAKPGDLCPSCGQATLVAQEGCRKCYSCGFSEC